MSEQLAFGRLVTGLSPWLEQLVFVGGWAFRLYRLHPGAQVPAGTRTGAFYTGRLGDSGNPSH